MKVSEEAVKMPERHSESAAYEVPADDEGADAKNAPTFGQACRRSVGGGVCPRLVDICAAFTDIEQVRRRSEHAKAKNFSLPSSQRECGGFCRYGPDVPSISGDVASRVINDVQAMIW